MSKKLTIVTSILCVLVLFVGVINIITVQNHTKALQNHTTSRLVSIYSSIGLGGDKLDYSINLTNKSDKTIFIQSVQPLVNETLKNRILSKEMMVTVNKEIKPDKAIAITGVIIVNTKGLKDMVKLVPFITDIKVISTETISLKTSFEH
ncbi:hypothetical protein [Clostridium estertheticum]|uniref:Uncharacterized protein n=1 Tax=Clostridium estertheticum TaxID=238834 RepID=A0AA47EMP7_9CLOT|nr:hypothetical protein [Clostridium estertheticum]MBU3157187.1 hypothetical protein [Clostridium estertheticum]WAG62696.1 hypothetical protein LL038_10880 [Clostridium estertheticum]